MWRINPCFLNRLFPHVSQSHEPLRLPIFFILTPFGAFITSSSFDSIDWSEADESWTISSSPSALTVYFIIFRLRVRIRRGGGEAFESSSESSPLLADSWRFSVFFRLVFAKSTSSPINKHNLYFKKLLRNRKRADREIRA